MRDQCRRLLMMGTAIRPEAVSVSELRRCHSRAERCGTALPSIPIGIEVLGSVPVVWIASHRGTNQRAPGAPHSSLPFSRYA